LPDKVACKLEATLHELGIEKAGLHALRHMAASEWLQGGAFPSVVQRRMRQSDSRITLQTYVQVNGDAQREAVEALTQRVLGDRIGVNPLNWSHNLSNRLKLETNGGSVWESNLLGADNPSTYEEAVGRIRKDLASLGTVYCRLFAASFSHPTFLCGSTLSTTLLFASRNASGTAWVRAPY